MKPKPLLRAALWGLTALAPISLAACYGGPMEECDADICGYDDDASADEDGSVQEMAPKRAPAAKAVAVTKE